MNSPLVWYFGTSPCSNWRVVVLVVRNCMNYAEKTTNHVADYNHTVLRNLQAAITDKDNGYDSSTVTPAPAQLQL